MGLGYEARGNLRGAARAYETFGRTCGCPTEVAPLLAGVYAKMHRYDDADAQLRIAQAAIATRRVDPGDVVVAFIAMGRKEDALHMLQRAGRGEFNTKMLALDPRMDPVRHDPRFRNWTQGPA